MNPSASGWIKKHFKIFEEKIIRPNYFEIEFYRLLKKSGFIYANSIYSLSYPEGFSTYELTPEEKNKVNYFDSLGFIYFKYHSESNQEEFIDSLIDFFSYLKEKSRLNFNLGLVKSDNSVKVERIINQRIQTNESIFQKNFSSLISNALLFLDVLTFKHFLIKDREPYNYAKSLEALIANTVYSAMKMKSSLDKHDELAIQLIESSIRYNKTEEVTLSFEDLDFRNTKFPLEASYIMDLACLTIFLDQTVEEGEKEFIQRLGIILGFSKKESKNHIKDVKKFISENKDQIAYLDFSNPIKNLYDNTFQLMRKLIVRNKKRLIKEISESKELMELLKESTVRDLSEEEKHKVKTQLMDIFKVIPSLAILILPGGSILLPIVIKLIPDLLPSGFADNK